MMFDAVSLHGRLKEHFPEVDIFSVPIKEAYSLDASPGKLIDLANAIYESVGKNAWGNTSDAPNIKKIEKAKLSDILTEGRQFFEDRDPDYYLEIYESLTFPATRILNRRNDHGDISHGHLAEKIELSYAHAATSLNLALSFAAYYFHILDHASARIDYDQHSEDSGFNEWLNEKGDKIGGASYSWLLYLHDYDAYESYFDEYQYS